MYSYVFIVILTGWVPGRSYPWCLCLSPVEELEVLRPTCATVDSSLLCYTQLKDIEGH